MRRIEGRDALGTRDRPREDARARRPLRAHGLTVSWVHVPKGSRELDTSHIEKYWADAP
jgi:hypothetical protein